MVREIVEQDIPKIRELILKTINEKEIVKITRAGGLTNRTYHIWVKGGEYVVRIPGEGTEEMINRQDEKISTNLACDFGH